MAVEVEIGSEVVAFKWPYPGPGFDAAGAALERIHATTKNLSIWRMLEPSEPPHHTALVVAMTERGSRPSLNKAKRLLQAAGGEPVPVDELPVRAGVSLVVALRKRRLDLAVQGLQRGEKETVGRTRWPKEMGVTLDVDGTMSPTRRPQG